MSANPDLRIVLCDKKGIFALVYNVQFSIARGRKAAQAYLRHPLSAAVFKHSTRRSPAFGVAFFLCHTAPVIAPQSFQSS